MQQLFLLLFFSAQLVLAGDGGGFVSIGSNTSDSSRISGSVAASNGTAAAPSISFSSDRTKGWYSSGTNQVALSIGGTQAFLFTSSAIVVNNSAANILLNSARIRYGGSANNIILGDDDANVSTSTSTIRAAASTGAGNAGAMLNISGGTPGAGGQYGRVKLQPSGGTTVIGNSGDSLIVNGNYYTGTTLGYITSAYGSAEANTEAIPTNFKKRTLIINGVTVNVLTLD